MVEVREIKASEARRWLDEGRAELIDIRDSGERGQMRIPEARWIPLTGLEAGLKAEPHQKIGIFHCRSGRRTQVHADQLAAVGYPETYVLEGGIMAWKKAGYPVASDSGAPIEIMRQVQIVAGSLVLLGVILGSMGSSWVFRIVRLHRGRPSVFRRHRFLRDGHDAGQVAVQPLKGFETIKRRAHLP